MTHTYAAYKRPTSGKKDLHRLKVKGGEKIFQANRQDKKASIAILIQDKIDFKKRVIKRDPEGHFIILKGRIHQEDINIVNKYAPNIGTTKYIRKVLEDFKKDIHNKTIIIGDFNTQCQQWVDLPNKISTRILWN